MKMELSSTLLLDFRVLLHIPLIEKPNFLLFRLNFRNMLMFEKKASLDFWNCNFCKKIKSKYIQNCLFWRLFLETQKRWKKLRKKWMAFCSDSFSLYFFAFAQAASCNTHKDTDTLFSDRLAHRIGWMRDFVLYFLASFIDASPFPFLQSV